MSAVDLVSQIPFNDMNYFILFEEIKQTDKNKYQSLDETQSEALVSQSLLMWCWSNSCNACVLYNCISDVNDWFINVLIYFNMPAFGRTEAL